MPEITNTTPESVEKQLHDLRELVLGQKAENEELRKREEALIKSLDERDRKAAEQKAVRTAMFSEPNEPAQNKGIQEVVKTKAWTDRDKEIHRVNDELYLASQLLQCHPRQLKMWNGIQSNTAVSELRKALNTSDDSEWIPTGFSETTFEKVALELKVGAIFPHITMPNDVYKPPTVAFDMTAYLMPESGSDESAKIPASKLTAGQFTLTAKKMAVRGLLSDEFSEGSLVPVLPAVETALVRAIGEAYENAILNGDTTATHQDSDVTSPLDQAKAWYGLRKDCIASSLTLDLSTFSTANCIALLNLMGDYANDPTRLVWITGSLGRGKLIANTDMLGMDKIGPRAVLLTGQVGDFLGSPVILSPKCRRNLNNSGVYDGSTVDKTVLHICHKSAYVFGDRKQITVERIRDPQTLQWIMVAIARAAFENPFAFGSETMQAMGIKIS